ncbi:hypothetical protein BpJC4_28000 [Weizmannia acidilactici]|nr:hypothetical protein BpJC4_28000 [Weizmannia acidilactici]
MFQNKSVNQKINLKFFKKIPFSSSNMKKRRYNALCKTENTNNEGDEFAIQSAAYIRTTS